MMLSRIKLNWELFKVIDSGIKEKIKYSQRFPAQAYPQIQVTEDVKLT